MKLYKIFSIISFLIYFPVLSIGQDSVDDIKRIYGLNPILYNGKIYTYFIPSNVKGNPYFNSPDFQLGSVTIKGIEYKNLMLNYDVLNQKLILKYTDLTGGMKIIEISDAWLEEFKLGNCNFKIMDYNNSKQFFQVFESDSISIFFQWKKLLVVENTTGTPYFRFHEPERKSFLYIHRRMIQYKNRREFVHLFDNVNQVKIKKFLRGHKWNIKIVSDQEVLELVKFCNNFYN